MTGMAVTIDRRFGRHGGRSTEWEITTTIDDLKEVILELPTFKGVQITDKEHKSYHTYSITLPEGVKWRTAGMVASAWAMRDRRLLMSALRMAEAEFMLQEESPDEVWPVCDNCWEACDPDERVDSGDYAFCNQMCFDEFFEQDEP